MTDGPEPSPDRLSPQAKRRVLRAALLRPWALLMLAIGLVFFATTLTWWALPLTLATYAALVALAVRDPIFQTLVLEGREQARVAAQNRFRRAALPPKARARRLPPGDNRDRVESALEARERVLVAIQGSDEPTQNLFSRALPKLNRAAELLVELAEARERAAETENSRASAIDAELSRAPEEFRSLRTEVVRASIESDEEASARAHRFDESLSDINRRLQELGTRT